MFWLDRADTEPGAATLRRFASEAADPELDRQAGALGRLLFSRAGGGSWSSRRPSARVARARKRRLKTADRRAGAGALSPLNPVQYTTREG